MLPISKPSSPEPTIRRPQTPPDHPLDKKSSFNSFTSFLPTAAHRKVRTCLLLSLLFLQLLLLLPTLHLSSSPLRRRRRHFPSPFPAPVSNQCQLGRVYIYDLPSTFNADLLSNSPAFSNDGFGPPAPFSDVIPPSLAPSWFQTDQFTSEIIYHKRLLSHQCRTKDPQNATAFYVPFYAGLAVAQFLFLNDSTPEDRDRHCNGMLTWLQSQPYFQKSQGWDHFVTIGRITWDFRRSKGQDWGSSCIYKPLMRNITRLLIERNPWDYFDVGVPYPTGFHPTTDSDLLQWQHFVRTKPRNTLFSFAGATRGKIKNDFRGVLLNHCRNESGFCRFVDCSGSKCNNGSSAILEALLDSDFCLQPRGDSFTRRSVFDCMVAGSVPVLLWKRSVYYQYEWFLPGEPESYSVFIHRDGVKNGTVNIREVLGRYGEEEVRRMREKVVELIPRIVYARREEGLESVTDAVDVAVDGVLRRFKEQEKWDYKW